METRGQEKFDRLYMQHYDRIWRYAFRLCRNRNNADDVTQEALLRAYRHYDRGAEVEHVEKWLLTIVRNAFFDMRRKTQSQPQIVNLQGLQEDEDLLANMADTTPGPDRIAESRFMDDNLAHALNELPEPQRELLVMASIEERPYQEIAEELQMPVGTVKSRVHRATQNLYRAYKYAMATNAAC